MGWQVWSGKHGSGHAFAPVLLSPLGVTPDPGQGSVFCHPFSVAFSGGPALGLPEAAVSMRLPP